MKRAHLQSYPRISPSNFSADISGKTVLITGGGHGIGPAIAASFATASAQTIILVGRNPAPLSATASSLSSRLAATTFLTRNADIGSKEAVAALFASLDGPVHVLVNNAGYLPEPSLFSEADLDELWEGLRINMYGTALITQKFLQHRRKFSEQEKRGPGVVLTLNTAVAYATRWAKTWAYAASKAALARWAELLTTEVEPEEARFVSFHPGVVVTNMWDKAGLQARGIEPADKDLVGDFTVWAATREAEFLNGRFVWAEWDVDELVAKKDEILNGGLLRVGMSEP